MPNNFGIGRFRGGTWFRWEKIQYWAHFVEKKENLYFFQSKKIFVRNAKRFWHCLFSWRDLFNKKTVKYANSQPFKISKICYNF